MTQYKVFIKDISKSHNETIAVCNKLVEQYKNQPDTKLIIDFSDCEFIYPDYALLFLCSIKYIEYLGYNVTGSIRCDTNKEWIY